MLTVSKIHQLAPSPSLNTVDAGADQRRVVAAPEGHPPVIPVLKLRERNFVDPCAIAPLKKRRVQVGNEDGLGVV